VDNIFREYVLESQRLHADRNPEGQTLTSMWLWFEEMNSNLDRIARRLGPARLEKVKAMLESGCYHQEQNGDPQAHKNWIRLLLRHYYDPMYDYQLQKRDKEPLLTGGKNVVEKYLRSLQR
jgi:tRNA 2-selenouridine synthase